MHTILKHFNIKQVYIVLILLFVIAVGIIGINGNFPLNDDWRYAALVKSFLGSGHFEIKQNFAPTIILQVFWGMLFCLPFGFTFVALRISTLILGLLAILLFARFIYHITQNAHKALLGSLILFVNPFFFNLSFSFMSDVPFIALIILSLWFFYKYSVTPISLNLFYAITASFLAFLIRQPGITLPVLYGCTILFFIKFKINRKNIFQLTSLIIIPVILYFVFQFSKQFIGLSDAYVDLHTELNNSFKAEYNFSILVFLVHHIFMTIILCSFFMAPLILLLPTLRLKKQHILMLLAGNIAIIAVLTLANRTFPYYNYFNNFCLGPTLLPDVDIFEIPNGVYFPKWVFTLFTFIGQLFATYLIISLYRHYKQNFTLFTGFLLLTLFVYIEITSITSFFDRYTLFPFVLLVILILPIIEIKNFKGIRKWLSTVSLVLIIFYSVAGTHDYLSWHRIKFYLFEYCQKQGISIEEMDAGHEINSWHLRKPGFISTSKISYRPMVDDKYLITFGMVDGYNIYASQSYYSYLHFREKKLYVLVRDENQAPIKKKEYPNRNL